VAGGAPPAAAAAPAAQPAVATAVAPAGAGSAEVVAIATPAAATGAGGKAETGGGATRPGGGKTGKGAPAKTAGASVALADADDDPTTKSGNVHRDHSSRPAAAHAVVPAAAAADADEGDDDARDKLKQANAALDSRNYDLAEKLANAVINSSATPRQRANARLIHGTVQCAARNDQEAAQIDLRNLVNFRMLHTRLLAVCRSHGVISTP